MRLQLIFAYRPLPFCRQVGLLASPRRPNGWSIPQWMVAESAMDRKLSPASRCIRRASARRPSSDLMI